MNSTKKTARIAGLLYLVNGVTGFFSIIYVPSRLIVSGSHRLLADYELCCGCRQKTRLYLPHGDHRSQHSIG